jgi:two-component system chemotaxis response regulator CheB
MYRTNSVELFRGSREPAHLPPGSPFGVVAIAASAGGVAALKALLGGLPATFPVPILVCQHVMRSRPSLLKSVLANRTRLRVVQGGRGEMPVGGNVYVAPPNRHMIVAPDGMLGLSDGCPENFCRPSADVLFRSVARFHGGRAIAVVLTGHGRDGAMGARAIQRCGGFAIAQDERSSGVFEMPLAARDLGGADLILPLDQIGPALQVLVTPQPNEAVSAHSYRTDARPLDNADGSLG